MTPLSELADVVDLVLPAPAEAPMRPRDRGRALAGHVLGLSAQLVAPPPGEDGEAPTGRIRRGADLVQRFWPASVDSHRSLWSSQSMYSGLSVASFGSLGSVLSAFSAGSILSIGSAGSILSIGSVGSVLSIGSAGSMFGIGTAGQRELPGVSFAEPTAALTRVVQATATVAAAGAVAAAAFGR